VKRNLPQPAVVSIVSIGSGTIPSGKKSVYVNDAALNVSGTVLVTLKNNMGEASGGGGLKYIDYTPGIPSATRSFQVVLNNVAGTAVNFNYAIISGSDVYN